MLTDLTDRLYMDTKTITVLDNEADVRSVLARYKKKGWTLKGTARDESKTPTTVTLILAKIENT